MSGQEEVVVVATTRGVGAYRWELALVAVTAVWGSTFVLVRDAVTRTAVILTMEPVLAGLLGSLLAGGPQPARDRRRPAMIRP